jgi:lambda family phage portal protein
MADLEPAVTLPVVASQGSSGVTVQALGGGLEGAERTSRETLRWNPQMGTMDQLIGRAKPMADARGRDVAVNDGYGHGAVATHKDSIVGAHYRLNWKPVLPVLKTFGKFDETWRAEAQAVVEARFNLIAESDSRWLDASRMNTLTDMVRLAVGGFCMGGEVCATAEWLYQDRTRPVKTAVQMFNPARLSTPDTMVDDKFLRRGVRKDARGRPLGYHIRAGHPREFFDADSYTWRYVPVEKPWGRKQVLHIVEQVEVDQTRGIADMVSAMKHMRMTKVYSETVLQNAVINASYAAALESELPPDAVYGMMGQNSGPDNFTGAMGAWMEMLAAYFGGAGNVTIDGAKIPVLPPGTKLNARTLGTPGGVGSNFEESLLRHTAAALGLSYEDFARDWRGVSYSGGRMAVSRQDRFMRSRKKIVADRYANFGFALVLEEEISAGNVPLPVGVDKSTIFYQPLAKDAFCEAVWIGAGTGQIDELKETQAAILRIKSGLSTYEIEVSRLGHDYRELFTQRAREEGIITDLKLAFSLEAQRDGQREPQNTLQNDPASGTQNEDKPDPEGGEE